MSIEIYNKDNPPSADILDLIGWTRYVINRQIGSTFKPKTGSKFFSNLVAVAANSGNLSVFRDDQNGKIRGYCAWYHNPDRNITYIHDLYALKHIKTTPVGTPLLNLVKDRAAALNHYAIELEASDYCIETAFYKNRGFVFKGTDDCDATAQTMAWYVSGKRHL
jgi:hypothetical protein